MNYPVWELYTAGGGLLIACIAVVHVYVAHFAVGGGLFLVWAEMKAYREGSDTLLDYVKTHTKFFLLLTMVFGGITGVGIWFTISLLNPSATSTLIHTFVFGWAAEWVCFLGEIVALFIYFYTFGKIPKGDHLKIGWLYFIFAWFSLFFINGIIGFMLTPGQWAQDGSFWSGFFNPTMWPALFFRTFIAFMFAGMFGFLTSMFIKDDKARESMSRSCAVWILVPLVLMLASGIWYYNSLPQEVQLMVSKLSPELGPYLKIFYLGTGGLFAGAVILSLSLPLPVKRLVAFGLLAVGLVYMGGFEFLREGGAGPGPSTVTPMPTPSSWRIWNRSTGRDFWPRPNGWPTGILPLKQAGRRPGALAPPVRLLPQRGRPHERYPPADPGIDPCRH